MTFPLSKKIRIGFSGASIILLFVALFSFQNNKKIIEADEWVEHTQKVEVQLQQVLVSSVDAETGVRGYAIVGTNNYLEPFERAKKKLPFYLDSLRSLTVDNPTQQKTIDTLNQLIDKSMLYLEACVEIRKKIAPDSEVACIASGEGKDIEDAIRKVIGNSKRIEDTLLFHRKIRSEEATRNFNIIFISLISILILILIIVYIIINNNLKTRRKADEQIRQLNADLQSNVTQLELLNRDLESFAYSISHDLKAPIRAMTSFAELLVERYSSKLGEEGNSFLKIISENGVKMNRMIDKLLEFSKLGSKDIEKVDVNMNSIINRCITELNATIKHHAKINVHSLAPAKGDPFLLAHVWSNLISNAIKYSDKTTNPQIDIGDIVRNGEVIYYVKDNGIGFDMAYADRLFQVFHRLHSQQEYEGVGIGLAIVQKIVIKHGGRVWAESEPSKGATFYFTLGFNGEGLYSA